MRFIYKVGMAISRFMQGRYGNDSLNQFLICVWCFGAILNIFLQSVFLYLIGAVFCFVVFYRMLSRNLIKRQRENAAWYRFSTNQKKIFNHFFVRIRDRKVARFFKCPRCKAPIRMPRKVGKFNVRCNKCGHVFQKEFKS
ncbi:MAG: hypothetical protein E7580_03970 [Ruminococcaceae bacterium]|nr:hypothetical protein [Oscillospiraceae bacterium]